MGKIKSRVLIVLSSIFAVSVAAFLGVTGLTKANAAENLTMKYGASIKCSPGANGLRFTAYVPDYNESENATYGMLIAPADYIENYPLTVENVFGENAVYDWAVKNDDGDWVYTGNKTRIINVSYDSLGTDKDGNYVVNGSILGIKDGNLTRNFVGRAYKKVGDEYTMAEWATASGDTEAKISNSIRCTLEVATAARLSGDSYTEAQAALIEDYEKRSYELAKYTDGDDYTLWFTKTTDSGEGSTMVRSEITDSAELPEGISKGYQLNVNYSGNWHRVFRNGELSDYVRLKYWVKGKYGLPHADRISDGESVWYPVEYVKQSNGLWYMYYNNELKIDNDTCLDIIFSDTTYVTDIYGVRDLRNSLRTVTYKDGDEVLHVEYVQKGRSAKYAMPSEDLGDGYIEEKEVKWTTENGGLVEANLDSITENITVYASYTTLIYKNHVKPKYVTAMSLNKYISVDSEGNIAFMVRLVGGAATVSVHNVDNTHADSERIILQSDWLSEGVWVIFKTDVANEKVYLCNENGTVLKEKDYPDLDVTTLLLCADDTPSADIAAINPKLYTVTYLDEDGTELGTNTVQAGTSAAYTPDSRTIEDGYVVEYSEVKWLVDGIEADLSNITSDMTVTYGGGKIVYINSVKPKYVTPASVNKYIRPDSDGNIAFMVRLVGGAATVSIHNVDNTHADSERIILQSDWLSEGEWVIFKTDVANEKVYLCNANGTVLKEKDYPNLDATTLLFCADDTPSADVAAINPKFLKKFNVTYVDDDGFVLGTTEVDEGYAAADFVPATRTTDDGYVIEYSDVVWLDNEAEVDLTSVNSDMTVTYGGGKIVYINSVKPKYVTPASVNKYIKPDADGNITFKVRLVGGAATVSVHNVDNTHADSERIILQSDWLSEGEWVIFKTDVANEKVYLCNARGTILKEKDYPNLDVTTLLFCADDTPSADVAAVIVKKNYNLNTLVVLNDYNTNVTPKDESGRMYKYAVSEFVELYEKLSGKGLSVKYVSSESDIVEGENCFYLGSGFASAAGFNCDGLTTDTGYSIRKANGNVYLYGKTGFGSLNAVYGFLKQVYGLEFYSDEVYTYNDSSFNYYELTATDFNPSIEYNWASGSLEYMKNDEPNYAYQRRLGFVNPWQMMGGSFHNYFDILPTETYQSAHPNWYTDACEPGSTSTFTTLNLAYGITESDSAMARAVADYIYNNVQLEASENRVKPVWIFGQPDVRGWSTSSESAALKEKYGSYSAESILFLKKVAKILDDEYTLGRKLELVILAYNLTFEAPSKNLDDLKFYNGDEVNMGVMYAPIESNLYRSATDTTIGRSEHSDVGTSGDGVAHLYEKSNAYYFGQLDEWKKLLNGGDILCYYYSAHYDNYFAPLDSITNMQSKYAAFANAGVKHIYNLGQRGDDVSTDWTALKIYLQSKYGENAYRTDGDTLILNFCNAYYGAAGNTMYELYKAYAATYKEASDYWTNLKNSDPMGCHLIRKYAFDKNAWGGSDTKLLNLYAKIETALGEVEANSEEYKRIQVEGITYRYLLAGVFGNTTKGTIADIATDAKSLGIDIFAEGSPYTATAGVSGNHYNTSGKIEDLA